MYAISELVAPSSCSGSLYAKFGDYEMPILIHAMGDRIVLSWYDGKAMTGLLRIPMRSEILVFSTLKWPGSFGDSLVVLDSDYTLSLLYKDGTGKYVDKTVTKLDTRGQQQSPGSRPLIEVAPSNDADDCYVMHVFLRTIQLVSLCHSAAQNAVGVVPQAKKRRGTEMNALWDIHTIYIGNIDVQAMRFLARGSVLAVLYSTYEFEYKLRYYAVDSKKNTITMIQQFESFSEPVSCIIPVNQGGLLAISGAHIFYFPEPQCSVSIALECEDPHLTRNLHTNVSTKSLLAQSIESEQVVSHVVIDDQRVLLVSQRGDTMMLFFEADKIGMSIVIKNLLLIRLGKSTIPMSGGLHHINKDTFLQVSRTSQLVLFLVSPQKPHIKITGLMELTGPILDLALTSARHHHSFITCQGAHYNSEVRKYGLARHSLTHLQTLTVDTAASRMVDVTGTDSFIAVKVDKKAFLPHFGAKSCAQPPRDHAFDYSTVLTARKEHGIEYFITEQGFFKAHDTTEPTVVLDRPFLHGKFLHGTDFIAITCSGELYVHKNDLQLQEEQLANASGIILLDVCRFKDTYYCLIVWRDGSYRVCAINPLKCVFESAQDLEAYSGVILAPSGLNKTCQQSHIVILTCEGDIFQTLVDLETGIEGRDHMVKFSASDIGLKLAKDSNVVFAYHKSLLLALKLDFLLNMYQAIPFAGKFNDIDDALMKDNKVYVLRSHCQIEQYEFSLNCSVSSMELEVLHAPLMKNKLCVLQNLKYYIAACFEEIGVDENIVSLELIDTESMHVLHKLELYRGANPVAAICPIPHERNSFVVLPMTGLGDFHTLRVHKKKLDLISRGTLENVDSFPQVANSKLQSIEVCDIDRSMFVVSGTVVFYAHHDPKTGKWAVGDAPILAAPYLSLGQTVQNDTVFICDMVEGLTKSEDDGTSAFLLPVILPYTHKFATCIGSVRCSHNEISEIVVGDAFGNILVTHFDGRAYEQVCAFNVGSQVNTLKCFDDNQTQELAPVCVIGTVNGGIYKLSRITNESLAETLQECQHELAQTCVAFGKSKLDWKQPQGGLSERRDYVGIVDIRLIQKYLADLLLEQEPHPVTQRHVQSRRNKPLLERIYFCSKTRTC